MGSPTAAVTSLLLGGIILLSGCSHSEETTKTEVREEQPSAAVRRAEESFNPSDYDRIPATRREDTTTHATTSREAPANLPAPPAGELAPGYRVQIISTTSIDEANAKKLYAESLFPTEWFYLQYDPPTYKIRAGNFLVRFDADRFRAQIAARGFAGAWVVPERVFKNPPPPTHDSPPTPK